MGDKLDAVNLVDTNFTGIGVTRVFSPAGSHLNKDLESPPEEL